MWFGTSLDRKTRAQLDRIEAALNALLTRENQMAADLTQLQAEVARQTSVTQSVIALITNLAAQLQGAKNDPAAIQAIIDQMRQNDDTLAASVTANTPAESGSQPSS